jgi:hypothetical protein
VDEEIGQQVVTLELSVIALQLPGEAVEPTPHLRASHEFPVLLQSVNDAFQDQELIYGMSS